MSNLSSHNPITMYETVSGNTELTQNPPQAAGQTFKTGSPIEINSSGFAQAWDGTTIVGKIYGISEEPGGNLGTAGEGYPGNFDQQGPPWSTFNIGPAPNQPKSVTIPYGAPFLTGGVMTMLAVGDTIFKAQTDTSEGETTITAASVALSGSNYVLTATATNVHYAGELILLSGFTGAGAPLNGQYATVLATGLSGTGYEAQLNSATYTGGAISTAGTGVDNPGPVSPTMASIGQQYGLTVDANGNWYIDFNKTTAGTNTVLVCIGLYPGDVLQSTAFTEVPNGQLLFKFLPSASQVQQ